MRAYSVVVAVFLGLILEFSCLDDAERTNPLDPASDRFNDRVAVSGQVFTLYAPFVAIPDVEVRLEPGPFTTKTDGSGAFVIKNVPEGSYVLSARKDGFAAAGDSVDVRLGGMDKVQVHLDGLPVISEVSISSCRIKRFFPQGDLLLLEVQTRVGDPDGITDIDVVEIEVPELNFVDTLDVTQTPGSFQKNITESRLPGRNLRSLIGRRVVLNVKDKPGFKTVSDPQVMARIIDLTPQFLAPVDTTLVPSVPTFTWQPVTLPFQFTFKIEVFREVQGITNKIESQSNIDSSTTSIQGKNALTPGDYLWTVSIVDALGNCSRSKEAFFQVN